MSLLRLAGRGLALFALACAAPVLASPAEADQVEHAKAKAGVLELELRALVVPQDDGNGGLTLEYGLSKATVLGFELELESNAGKLKADEVSFQLTQVLADPKELPLGLGLQLSAGYAFEDRALAVRATAIADIARPDWRAAANLIAASREGDRGRFDLSYAARIDWNLPRGMTIGLETGGGLAAGDPVGHWAGPAFAVPLGKANDAPRLELSAFAGLSRSSPDLQLRLEIDWEL